MVDTLQNLLPEMLEHIQNNTEEHVLDNDNPVSGSAVIEFVNQEISKINASGGTDITGLQTDIDSNTTAITTLQSSVGNNTTAISGLQTDIGNNTTAISGLQTDIDSNTTAISGLQTDIGNNTTAITNLQASSDKVSLTFDNNTFSIPNHANVSKPPLSASINDGSLWDNVNQKIVISKTGTYHVGGIVSVSSPQGTSIRYVAMRIIKNGTELRASRTQIQDFGSGTNYESIPVNYLESFTSGDEIEFKMSASSTGSSVDQYSDSNVFLKHIN